MRFLFTSTLLASSLLLFWIQPMLSKMLLPYLGGVPAVWNTCLVFYQATLLAGYLYVYLSSKLFSLRKQAIVHVVLAWLALGFISFNFDDISLSRSSPVLWLFQRLLLSIGFPFFLLSATAPMLQRWFTYTRHPHAKTPYFLYAVSNLGSVAALLSYPLLLEPFLRLGTQTRLWSAGYGLLAVLLSGCAVAIWKFSFLAIRPLKPVELKKIDPNPLRKRLHWLLLTFIPSGLLLGVTHHITTDVASLPFFWVIPLALYLLTFVLVFARKPVIQHEWMLKAQTYLVLPVLVLFVGKLQTEAWIDFPVHLIAFFVFAMVCHGELVKIKPQPERLTEFYVWMAAGGVLGGIFTALVAPVLFNSIVEYPFMIVLSCLIRPATRATIEQRYGYGFLVAVLSALVVLAIGVMTRDRAIMVQLGTISLMLAASFGGALGFYFLRTPTHLLLGLGSFLLIGIGVINAREEVLIRKRNFFGTLRVSQDPQGKFHIFYHGTTLQGAQSLDPNRRSEALTYYHREGPLGQIFDLVEAQERRSIAVIGLGAGTIAAYARADDTMVFYEIDADVETIARDPRWFRYLQDCPGQVRVILGDARISLADAPDRSYDIIIEDALSSDVIPTHLLTREAFQLYKMKLSKGGFLAFNISSRYLGLEPVLAALVDDAGLYGMIRRDSELSPEDQRAEKHPSVWVVAAQQKRDLGMLLKDPRWKPLEKQAGIRVWTDDYSDVLSILKLPGMSPD